MGKVKEMAMREREAQESGRVVYCTVFVPPSVTEAIKRYQAAERKMGQRATTKTVLVGRMAEYGIAGLKEDLKRRLGEATKEQIESSGTEIIKIIEK